MEHFLPFNDLFVNGDLADKQKAQAIYKDFIGGLPIDLDKLRRKNKSVYFLLEEMLME
ncbi:MAG: hypothetical protein GY804_04110 [Alphaproteobacteria bacterium]|nr:hypothetical protein [Alphaproteobacteria bacterium]